MDSGPNIAGAERVLRITGLLCWMVMVPPCIPPLFPALRSQTGLFRVGFALVVLHLAVVGLALLRRWFGPRVCALSGLLLVAGSLLMMPQRQAIDPSNVWAPGYWAAPWAFLLLVSVDRRRYWSAVLTILPGLLLVDVLVQWAVGEPLETLDLLPLPGFLIPVFTIILFCDGLGQLARRADEAVRLREDLERGSTDRQLRVEAERESARLLHDHVLHALNAVSHADGTVPPEVIAEECRRAVEVVSEPTSPTPEGLRLEALVAVDPALATAGGSVHGHSPRLPRGVAEAMAGAAHEALVNVARHAGADTSLVEVDWRHDRWHCTISDDGIGFEPARVNARRLGVRRSIVERMQEVGGAARIHSAPGAGTRVELLWPARPAGTDPEGTAAAAARWALARSAWPQLAAAPVFTLLLLPLVDPAWPVLLATALLMTVGGWSIHQIRRRPLHRADVALLALTSLMVWSANLLTAPDNANSVGNLWLAWGCAALGHLVVIQTRLKQSILAMLVWLVVMMVPMLIRYGMSLDLSRIHPILTVGILEATLSLTIYHAGRRTAHRGVAQHQRAVALDWDGQRREALRQVEDHWSRQVTDGALGLLRRVAQDPGLVGSPQTAREAALLEATLRDELLLGHTREPLLRALSRARADGWRISLYSGDADLMDEATRRLLEGLGAPTAPGQELTLNQGRTTVTAVALEPSHEQAQRWQHALANGTMRPRDLTVDVEGGFARVTVEMVSETGPLRRSSPPCSPSGPSAPGAPAGTCGPSAAS